MAKPKFDSCRFDPNLCPLLQGLSPEEQAQRMQDDPLICACIARLEQDGTYPAPCANLNAGLVPAARIRRKRATAV